MNTSIIEKLVVIVFPALLAGCITVVPPLPKSPAGSIELDRVAASGVPQRITFFYYVNPDCSSGGIPRVVASVPPSHGAISTDQGEEFTDFPAANQRYECNKKKSPVLRVKYTSDASFKGEDRFSLETIFPNGSVKNNNVVVKVE